MIVLTKIITHCNKLSLLQLNMMMVRTIKPPKLVENLIANKLR